MMTMDDTDDASKDARVEDEHGFRSSPIEEMAASSSPISMTNWIRPGFIFGCIFVWLSITGGRFLAPFLEQEVGMTPKTIGLCLAGQSVITTLGGFIIGPWADRREARYPGRGRTQIMALGVLVGTVCSLLHSVPHLLPHAPPNESPSNDQQPQSPANQAESFASSGLFSFTSYHFALRMLYAACVCCIFPVIDAVTLQYLENHPQMSKDDYGRERLFGAVGWAITHLGYAVLIDWFGFQVTYPLTLISVVVALLAIYIYTRQEMHDRKKFLVKRKSDIMLPDDPQDISPSQEVNSSAPEVAQQHADESILPRGTWILRLFFGTYFSTAFMICLFLLSFGQVLVDSLVFLFFETLESSYTMMGFTVILTVAFEIPIFQVAPTLLERSNASTLLLVACVSYIVRVLGYAAIPKGHIAYVLVLEPLHGVTYACTHTAAVDTAARYSPVGWEATGQGLISMVRGAGSFLGLLYGGWAVQHQGGRVMYEISSCLVSFGVLCLGMGYYFQTPETSAPAAVQSSSVGGSQYSGLQQQEEGDSETFVIDDDDDEEEDSSSELELRPL